MLLLLDHTVHLKMCFTNAREEIKEEKAMRSKTHRPPTQKKGKGNCKDDRRVKSRDDNWMAERTASPNWREMKVSRRGTSRGKATGNGRLPPRTDLMENSAVGRICNGCKES